MKASEREERTIMAAAVDALLKSGFEVTVWGGVYETVVRSTDPEAILAGMRTSDQDYLLAHLADLKTAQGSGPLRLRP